MCCGRLLALADGRCCYCHRCCQPRSGDRVRGRDQTVRVVPEPDPGQGRERHFLPVVQGLTRRLCPTAPGICPVTARTFQGMAPYPGQARCLALGFWPECFRRLNVKGGGRPFPKETRSALDIEGKHVTIQGPSAGLSPAAALAPSACATWLPHRSVDSSAGIQTRSDQSATVNRRAACAERRAVPIAPHAWEGATQYGPPGRLGSACRISEARLWPLEETP